MRLVAGGIERLRQQNLDQRRRGRELRGAAQWRDRFRGVAAFEQRLTLEFVEIGVVRHFADQRVDLRHRVAQVAVTIGGDGAGIARGQAGIAQRIATADALAAIDEAVKLGAHQIVAQLQLGGVLLVPGRARFREHFERGDTLGRHRMRLLIRVGEARREQHLVAEPLERIVQPLGGLACGGEEFHRGAVGLFFLAALVRQERAAQRFLRRQHRRHAGIAEATVRSAARTGDHGADAEQHGDDRGGLRRGELFAQPCQMPTGDVAGLVREHADHLVRRLGVHQRAGIDEDAAAVHDEGVEGLLVDDGDADVLLREAGGAQDRLRVVAQQLLGLGVADDRNPRRLCAGRRRCHQHRRRRQHSDHAARRFDSVVRIRQQIGQSCGHYPSGHQSVVGLWIESAQPREAAPQGQRERNHMLLSGVSAYSDRPNTAGAGRVG